MGNQVFVYGLQMKSSIGVWLVACLQRINPLVEAKTLVEFDKNLRTSWDTPEDNWFPGNGCNSTSTFSL